MKSLPNYSAFADNSSGTPPKLKPFKALTRKLSRSACNGFLSLAVVTSVVAVASEAQANYRYMRLGMSGPAVSDVQAALGIPADGLFGPHTQLAVMEFQSRCGLLVDGVVGPETWSALFGGGVAAAPVSAGYASGGNNILEPGIEPPSAVLPPAVTGPYVVVVPNADEQQLLAVKQIVPDAVIDGDLLRRGFINAGGYPNYASAQEVAGRLIGFGFDARVDYFERYEPADNAPGNLNLNGYTPSPGSYTPQ